MCLFVLVNELVLHIVVLTSGVFWVNRQTKLAQLCMGATCGTACIGSRLCREWLVLSPSVVRTRACLALFINTFIIILQYMHGHERAIIHHIAKGGSTICSTLILARRLAAGLHSGAYRTRVSSSIAAGLPG